MELERILFGIKDMVDRILLVVVKFVQDSL